MFIKRTPRIRAAASLLFVLAVLLPSISAVAKKKPPDHPIDLNVANIKELEELPGIGPTTAQAILDFREKSGKFKRVEDLLVIRGISQTKFERMRPYLTVGPAPAVAKPAAAQPSAGAKSPPKTAASAKQISPPPPAQKSSPSS